MPSGAEQIAPVRDLRILIVEDGGNDADAIEQTLRTAKLAFTSLRASGKDSFACALEKAHPDIVILNNRFASMDSYNAIKLVQDKSPGLPIIVVDAELNEDSAVALARSGVHDYVASDGLARLAFAVEHIRLAIGDVPVRRRIERDLAFQAAVLAAEHEASPDGILVVDPDGRIVSFNRNFVSMWGIPPEVAASGSDRLALDSVMDKLVDRESFVARVRDLYQHQNEKSVDEIALKDGRIFHRYTAPMELDGRYLGRVWFFHDITPYKEAEKKILEDASQFRGLVEQEIAGIFILRRDGTIAYVNPRFVSMLGYSPGEPLGHSVLEYFTGADKEQVQSKIMEVVSGARTSSQVTASLLRKDGTYLPILGQGTIATYQGQPALVGITLDISELRQAQAKLERSNRVLKTLSAGNTALVHTTTEAELLKKMCGVMVDVGGYKFAWIGYAQHDAAKTVLPVAWSDHAGDYIESAGITWSDSDRGLGPTGEAIRTGQSVVNQDFATNPALEPWREEAVKRGFGSSIALPLKDGTATFGVISIYAAEPSAFSEDEKNLLAELAGDLAYGIISLRARIAQDESVQRLRRSMQATVLAIASTLEQRDPYTAGHQRAVAQLAAAIARELMVPEDEIEGIYLAGVVHDIGKIQIPAEILAKPGKLSRLEYELVQTHAKAGYDIIKGVEFPWPVADMILQHHERMDGSGYPQALKGDQILIGARIIAVADVVQAMTARRPYRGALGLDAALAEVERNKGTKYYAPAVDACLNLFRNEGFKFESDFGHESS